MDFLGFFFLEGGTQPGRKLAVHPRIAVISCLFCFLVPSLGLQLCTATPSLCRKGHPTKGKANHGRQILYQLSYPAKPQLDTDF